MFLLFIVSVLVAMAVAGLLPDYYRAFGEDVDDPTNPLLYVGMVLIFTAFILYIARKGMQRLIQAIILFAVGMTMYYVMRPILWLVFSYEEYWTSEIIAIQVAVVLTYALYAFPEWYIIDSTGILVAAGAASIFGISLGVLPAIILLAVLAVYDAIAVYRTKHMVDLADSVMDLRLPILLVVPKKRGYSFMEQARLKDQLESGEEREAMFMGLGDVIIPSVLIVSSLENLPRYFEHVPTVLGAPGNLVVALCSLAGTLVGYWVLMYFVASGRPQAGLPLLNSGAIAGYLLSVLLIFGHVGISLFGTVY
jgi:presenilin-like A22 family membrane protease